MRLTPNPETSKFKYIEHCWIGRRYAPSSSASLSVPGPPQKLKLAFVPKGQVPRNDGLGNKHQFSDSPDVREGDLGGELEALLN